jgi:integrase
MASIKKVVTAGGEVRYRVRSRVEGRSVEEWARTFEKARAMKTAAEADSLAGITVDPRAGARLLSVYFDEWLPARLVKGRPLTPSTRLGYKRLWKRTARETLGKRELRAVRPETVRNWYGGLAASAGQDQAAKAYRLLRAVLATAEADDLIRQNPCRIRGGGQEHHDERPMIDTALVLDLADAIVPRLRACVLVAGFAGLRTGESLGLRRRDVDLLHGELRVVVQAQEVAGEGRVVLAPKSEAGKRTVVIPKVVADALETHMAEYTGPDLDAPVFTGPEGGPLRRARLSAAWRDAVKATGAPEGLHPHDLRHHAATLTARMPGVTTKELMARIGHASPRAALIYQHATAERDRAIATYLDGVVEGTERPARAPVVNLAEASRGGGVGLDAEPGTGREARQGA